MINDDLVQCQVCKMYVKRRGLQSHMRLAHLEPRLKKNELLGHNVIQVDNYWLSIATFFQTVEMTIYQLATPAIICLVVLAFFEQTGLSSA